MKLTELKVGERGIVRSVESPLGGKLRALGLCEGETVEMLAVSPLKGMYLVGAGGIRIALRREAAECVLL